MARVAVNIVTWNSQEFIPICLDSVLQQTYPNISITVFDNGSSDETISALASYAEAGINWIQSSHNLGYAAAHNQLIRATDSDYVLTLNPDVHLTPSFVEQAVYAIERSPTYGSVSGKLLSVSREHFLRRTFDAIQPSRIDEAGMTIYPSRRQFIRDYQKISSEHCQETALIFGPCGAAAFYRRAMLEDVSIDGEHFDEAFFVHKEDVDMAWRAQLLGWQSSYTPHAIGYHVRSFHPGQRKEMSSEIRHHAIKNRWLMAVKNELAYNFLRDLPYIVTYEAKILAYLLIFEQDSLSALFNFLRLVPRATKWRRSIQRRRQRSGPEMAHWFHEQKT